GIASAYQGEEPIARMLVGLLPIDDVAIWEVSHQLQSPSHAHVERSPSMCAILAVNDPLENNAARSVTPS
ncbi:hypothetical protein, partial [Ferrimicrobium sp.]|uniref:hypothetical protein n=1 Tax=Ferrimicrobium sp. TaxID=2926050 RepID=UPI0026104B10